MCLDFLSTIRMRKDEIRWSLNQTQPFCVNDILLDHEKRATIKKVFKIGHEKNHILELFQVKVIEKEVFWFFL